MSWNTKKYDTTLKNWQVLLSVSNRSERKAITAHDIAMLEEEYEVAKAIHDAWEFVQNMEPESPPISKNEAANQMVSDILRKEEADDDFDEAERESEFLDLMFDYFNDWLIGRITKEQLLKRVLKIMDNYEKGPE